nr:hypothetical protein BaRGS_015319 [Batillaria attramentaria]
MIRFWLDRGVDGIRVDAVGNIMVDSDYYQDQARSYAPGTEWWQADYYVNNLTHDVPEIREVVRGWREVLDSYDDSHGDTDNSKLMIVELYEGPKVRQKYFDYGSDLPFNFELVLAIDRENNQSCDAMCIRDVIEREYDALPEGEWANFVLSNHDNHRASSRYGARYVDAMNMLLLTLRGTPTTYYGEELGMEDITVSYGDTQDPYGKTYGPVWIPTIVIALIIGIAVAVTVVLVKGGDDSEDRSPANLKWWQKTIVYQIYPRSFKDTDGDGVGDLKGIVSKLDHFTYLGVGAIWISPFYPSPMRDIGYDTTSQVDVDPLFGNLTDFDLVVKEAHERDHPWFQKSVKRIKPYDEYYVWADGLKLDNGSIVRPSNWPQLNYRSAHVREDMKNVIRFWFERGVDGMRVDAVAYMMVSSDYYKDQPNSGADDAEPMTAELFEIISLIQFRIQDGNNRVLSGVLDVNHLRFMVVELYDLPEVRNRYYDYGADMPFNFDLVTAINPVYHPEHCDAICIRDEIKQEYDTLPEGKWANFVLSNHDNMRASTRIGPRYADALHVLLLTLQGTPTTYYGEELAMLDIQVSFEETVDPWGINYGPDHYREVSRDPV